MRQAKFIHLSCVLINETLNGGQEDMAFTAYLQHDFQFHKNGEREHLYYFIRHFVLLKKLHNVV